MNLNPHAQWLIQVADELEAVAEEIRRKVYGAPATDASMDYEHARPLLDSGLVEVVRQASQEPDETHYVLKTLNYTEVIAKARHKAKRGKTIELKYADGRSIILTKANADERVPTP